VLQARLNSYFDTLGRLLPATACTDKTGRTISLSDAYDWATHLAIRTHAQGNKLMFIGNGGSAAIASHMATDFTKNGNLRTVAFNDGSMLTCLGNDLGYENVFAKQIEMHARQGDLLVAISSSGRSANILRGVGAARTIGCAVLTLSGFQSDNPLRRMGDVNMWVNSGEYGFVEIAHLALCHAVLDMAMGWGAATPRIAGTARA
jgi:D-sedoheptulose 7-phosphate isomerase